MYIHNNLRKISHQLHINQKFCNKTMNLSSRTILLPAIALLIGAVVSTTTASNAYAQEDPFDNKIDEDIDVKHTISCDETGNGDNSAHCE
ncbi:MAG: hypothetical protein ACRD93_06650, partial [Nitrososphaeraceae archaeon]